MNWRYIILHHSATADGRTFDWPAIKRYHMSYRIDGVSITPEEFERRLAAKDGKRFERPWHDIGYNFGVERVGNEYEVVTGRSLNEPGAHTVGMNAVAIGVCCVGNYDLAPPPEEMIEVLVGLIKALRQRFDIPIENIKGHRDYAPKTCPGAMFDIEEVRGIVQRQKR